MCLFVFSLMVWKHFYYEALTSLEGMFILLPQPWVLGYMLLFPALECFYLCTIEKRLTLFLLPLKCSKYSISLFHSFKKKGIGNFLGMGNLFLLGMSVSPSLANWRETYLRFLKRSFILVFVCFNPGQWKTTPIWSTFSDCFRKNLILWLWNVLHRIMICMISPYLSLLLSEVILNFYR